MLFQESFDVLRGKKKNLPQVVVAITVELLRSLIKLKLCVFTLKFFAGEIFTTNELTSTVGSEISCSRDSLDF